jgi:enediyne biosynthesis protein E4
MQGFGLYLRNPGNGEFEALEFQSSGVFVPGEARALKEVRTSDGRILIVARNDDTVLFFKPNE